MRRVNCMFPSTKGLLTVQTGRSNRLAMKGAKHMRTRQNPGVNNVLRRAILAVCSFALVSLGWTTHAAAQGLGLPSATPGATSVISGPDVATPFLYGVSRAFAPRLQAIYGLGLADETSLSNAFLRLDEQFAIDPLSDRYSRDNWRHFLGMQLDAGDGFLLHGGVAKSSGVSGNRFVYPTGYERLRLSTGARWKGEDWGLDSSFSFIPTGATRVPGDAGFVPGMGQSEATWLFAFSVVRWF